MNRRWREISSTIRRTQVSRPLARWSTKRQASAFSGSSARGRCTSTGDRGWRAAQHPVDRLRYSRHLFVRRTPIDSPGTGPTETHWHGRVPGCRRTRILAPGVIARNYGIPGHWRSGRVARRRPRLRAVCRAPGGRFLGRGRSADPAIGARPARPAESTSPLHLGILRHDQSVGAVGEVVCCVGSSGSTRCR